MNAISNSIVMSVQDAIITLSQPSFITPDDEDITSNSITLSWTPSYRSDNNEEVDYYHINIYGDDGDLYYAQFPTGVNTYTFTDLSPETTYRFTIGVTYLYYNANGQDIYVTTIAE